jgi:DNA-binding CsgD family transcriptional regulator
MEPDSVMLDADGIGALGLLSPAEMEVCALALRGLTANAIADRRDTSPETARGQLKSAAAKLGCRTRLDMLRLAMETRPPTGSSNGISPVYGSR